MMHYARVGTRPNAIRTLALGSIVPECWNWGLKVVRWREVRVLAPLRAHCGGVGREDGRWASQDVARTVAGGVWACAGEDGELVRSRTEPGKKQRGSERGKRRRGGKRGSRQTVTGAVTEPGSRG